MKRYSYIAAFVGMGGIILMILIAVIWHNADDIDKWFDGLFTQEEVVNEIPQCEVIPQYDAVWRGVVEESHTWSVLIKDGVVLIPTDTIMYYGTRRILYTPKD